MEPRIRSNQVIILMWGGRIFNLKGSVSARKGKEGIFGAPMTIMIYAASPLHRLYRRRLPGHALDALGKHMLLNNG